MALCEVMRLINVVGSKSWLPVVGLRERANPPPTSSFLTLACSSKDSKVERGGLINVSVVLLNFTGRMFC